MCGGDLGQGQEIKILYSVSLKWRILMKYYVWFIGTFKIFIQLSDVLSMESEIKSLSSRTLTKQTPGSKQAPLQHNVHVACFGKLIFIRIRSIPEGAFLIISGVWGQTCWCWVLDYISFPMASTSLSCHLRICPTTQNVPAFHQHWYMMREK